MDSKGSFRFIIGDLGILEGLTYKHITRKTPFTIANYRNPCSDDMSECGRAFTNVCNYLEDILQSVFETMPRGDKEKVYNKAKGILSILTTSYISV